MSWSTTNVSDIAARLTVLGITQQTLDLLTETWPLIQPHVESGIDAYFISCQALPWVAEKLVPNRTAIRSFYNEHFRILFNGWLDERYRASLDRKRDLDIAIDLRDARPHLMFSHFVLKASVTALSRRHRFSAPAMAKRITALMQVLAFDAATNLAYVVDDLTRRSEERRTAVDESISTFDATARSLFDSLMQGSSSLRMASRTMDTVAENARTVILQASQASHETAESVLLTASATDEIAHSIAQIREQASTSSAKAGEVAADARETQDAVKMLSGSVDRIGSVAEMIAGIAGQTNLLALNAAIEAARAGDAGRGFSVVATEVKLLAEQTARATEEIARQIAVVQNATANTARAIQSISARITELTENAGAIALSVESQSSATEAISKEMQLVLDRTRKSASAMEAVQARVAESGQVSSEVVKLAETLSQHSDDLAVETRQFFDRVRTA